MIFLKLLKIRAAGLFSSMFKGSNKGKTRGIGFKILIGILALYVVSCFVLMFGMLFYTLCEPLCSQGITWLYFGLALLFAMVLSFIGSVFATQSQLFDARDNELLLSMPIKPRTVLASRMAVLMLLNFFYELLVLLPAFAVYMITRQMSPIGMICFIFGAVVSPFFTMSISSLFAWLISLITARFQFKNLITLLLSIGFLGVYFVFYFQLQNYLNALIQNGKAVAEAVRKVLFPIYHFGMAAAEGNIFSFLLFLFFALIPFGIVYFILNHNFIRIVTAKHAGKKTAYQAGRLKVKSCRSALIERELRHFFSNAMYMLNAAIGVILTIAAAVVFALKKDTVIEFAAAMPGLSSGLPALACAVICFCTAMNFISAPSISLEGRNLWIIRSMPVKSEDVLLAKVYAHIVITTLPVLIAALIFDFVLKVNLLQGILMFLVPLTVNVLCGLLGVILNLHFPKFDWMSETAAVKQGASPMMAMLVSMAAVMIPTVLYVAFLSKFMIAEWYLFICALIFSALSGGMIKYCKTKGSRLFEQL